MKLLEKCIFFIILCGNIYADDTIVFPEEINPFIYIYDEDKDTSGSMEYDNIYFFPRIRIWGWSSDGKVAYSIQERDNWQRETWFVRWYIFDFVDDKVLWQETTTRDGRSAVNIHMQAERELFEEYSYNSNKINEVFSRYNIKNISVPYKFLPMIFNNKTYVCTVTQIDENDDYLGINEYTVTVEFNSKKKTVMHKILKESNLMDDVYLCGYFISPFENRALLIIAEKDYTFEEYELRYVFTGCHLENGFK
ncbi:hypothetical protein FACS189491_04190 [Spirochaetia bacterium]|nr:hypothetical protein FACS189491_04190 [Spirochaetia bacterium]